MFQTPTSMQTHRRNIHGSVPDITPGHPLGRPKSSTSTSTSTAEQETEERVIGIITETTKK